MRPLSIVTGLAALALAGAAEAHPKLVSSNPAPNTVVAKPARVELRFSEKLMPAFSKAELVRAGAKAALPGSAVLAADARTLVVTPKGQLRPGRYTVSWQVVSVDTHRIAGHYAFAVK